MHTPGPASPSSGFRLAGPQAQLCWKAVENLGHPCHPCVPTTYQCQTGLPVPGGHLAPLLLPLGKVPGWRSEPGKHRHPSGHTAPPVLPSPPRVEQKQPETPQPGLSFFNKEMQLITKEQTDERPDKNRVTWGGGVLPGGGWGGCTCVLPVKTWQGSWWGHTPQGGLGPSHPGLTVFRSQNSEAVNQVLRWGESGRTSGFCAEGPGGPPPATWRALISCPPLGGWCPGDEEASFLHTLVP